jgi:hypothetical protein
MTGPGMSDPFNLCGFAAAVVFVICSVAVRLVVVGNVRMKARGIQ